MESQIKVSIITITYNSERTIEETVKSVISQGYPYIEYIIIDGGSSDKTLDILSRYQKHITYLVSEKDKGISDAFNKGIHKATGDLIGIINSDDLLLPDSIVQIVRHYDKNVDVYRGNTVIWNETSQFRCREIPSMKFPTVPYTIHVSHQGTFITPRAYQKYGLFDLDFHYAMDLELLCRYYRLGATFKYMDVDVALFRIGGTTSDKLSKKKKELKSLIIKNGGNQFQAFLYYTNLCIVDCIKSFLNLFGEDFKRKIRYRKIN